MNRSGSGSSDSLAPLAALQKREDYWRRLWLRLQRSPAADSRRARWAYRYVAGRRRQCRLARKRLESTAGASAGACTPSYGMPTHSQQLLMDVLRRSPARENTRAREASA